MSLHPSAIDLAANTRTAMVATLNTALATAVDLSAQTKQAHWNVRGPDFGSLHAFFDSLHGLAVGMVDELAERITALGGLAEGRIATVASATVLPAYQAQTDQQQHLQALAAAFAAFGAYARKAIDTAANAGDQGTADLFTGISRELDKQLWMIEAHLGK